MVRSRVPKSDLTADDWLQAAIATCAAGGVGRIAVEPLARTLGVTKGSFYWHFKNRGALVEEMLSRWETVSTEAIIAATERVLEPRARLSRLFDDALALTPPEAGRWAELHSPAFEQALAAAADDPLVGPFFRRVAERRLRYLEACYSALGFSTLEAGQRALLAYTTYVGTMQLRRDVPDQLPRGNAYKGYLEHLKRTLIP